MNKEIEHGSCFHVTHLDRQELVYASALPNSLIFCHCERWVVCRNHKIDMCVCVCATIYNIYFSVYAHLLTENACPFMSESLHEETSCMCCTTFCAVSARFYTKTNERLDGYHSLCSLFHLQTSERCDVTHPSASLDLWGGTRL